MIGFRAHTPRFCTPSVCSERCAHNADVDHFLTSAQPERRSGACREQRAQQTPAPMAGPNPPQRFRMTDAIRPSAPEESGCMRGPHTYPCPRSLSQRSDHSVAHACATRRIAETHPADGFRDASLCLGLTERLADMSRSGTRWGLAPSCAYPVHYLYMVFAPPVCRLST